MLHYNFPALLGRRDRHDGHPKRREIGHGRLAKRALLPCCRAAEEFPLMSAWSPKSPNPTVPPRWRLSVVRLPGLMDAGVPIKAPLPVSPWADQGRRPFAVLTDILGDEDHLATWTSRWPVPARTASPPCRWTSRSGSITKRSWSRAGAGEGSARLHIWPHGRRAIQAPRAQIIRFRPAHPTSRSILEKIQRRDRQGWFRDPCN